ncbi:MAG: phytanoyl-CoA dioxygenase family protein [Chloroflexi bacterium]|nr:phytanoyl-CoA dioxygenase family protein [Chloroflexota bacterium]
MESYQLPQTKIEQFQTEGYTFIPDFFSQDEVAAMRVELERFKSEGLGRNVATDGDGKTHSTTKINYQIIPLNDKSTLFRALPFNPKVISAIGQLIGTPFVRHLDQIFLKPGRTGAGTSWHTDNAYFKISDPTKGTGMWVALHDATLANGTLHVIPRSHLETFEHERDPGSDHHITFRADDQRAVPIELPAGGAIFFNYGIGHGTTANNTDNERAGLAYHFLRADYIPENYPALKSMVYLTGPETTGGEREYGVKIEGTWSDEVQRLSNPTRP